MSYAPELRFNLRCEERWNAWFFLLWMFVPLHSFGRLEAQIIALQIINWLSPTPGWFLSWENSWQVWFHLPKWKVLYAFIYGKQRVCNQVFLLCNRSVGITQCWDNMVCSELTAKWLYPIKGLWVLWAHVTWPLGGTRC